MHFPVHDGWYLSSSGSEARHSQGLAPVATSRCCYATRTPVDGPQRWFFAGSYGWPDIDILLIDDF
jgi:hypothetical protein